MILLADIGKSGSRWKLVTEGGAAVRNGVGAGRDEVIVKPETFISEKNRAGITGICIGLAGLSKLSPEQQEIFKDSLEISFPDATEILVHSDADLMAAAVKPESLIISLGSGSVIVHVSKGRNQRFFGGWGTNFGDELSGWWWFRALVRETLQFLEGRPVSADVPKLFFELTGCSPERRSIIQFAEKLPVTEAVAIGYQWLARNENHPATDVLFETGWNQLMSGIPSTEIQSVYLQGGITRLPGIRQKLTDRVADWLPGVPIYELSDLTLGAWNLWQDFLQSPRSS